SWDYYFFLLLSRNRLVECPHELDDAGDVLENQQLSLRFRTGLSWARLLLFLTSLSASSIEMLDLRMRSDIGDSIRLSSFSFFTYLPYRLCSGSSRSILMPCLPLSIFNEISDQLARDIVRLVLHEMSEAVCLRAETTHGLIVHVQLYAIGHE